MKVCILVDSRDRDLALFPTPTTYTVALPQTLYDVTRARLLTAELPASFYAFSAARGTSTLSLVRNGGVPLSVTIPDGTYGVADLVLQLKQALTAAAGVPIDVDLAATTSKITISSPQHPADTLVVLPTGLAARLGFPDTGSVQGVGSVTAPRVCACAGDDAYAVLDIEELGTTVEPRVDGGVISRRAFAKIPLNVDAFQYAAYDKQITAHVYARPIAMLTKLRLHWRFHTGEPIEFHGVDHSLTLEVECADVRRPDA